VRESVLRVLEFPDVLEGIASRATSAPGREAVRALRPGVDLSWIRAELKRVEETAAFLKESPDWVSPEIPDARGALRRLAVEGAVLEPLELYRLGRLLAAGRELLEVLEATGDRHPALSFLRAELLRDRGGEERVERTVEADGTILDAASRELKRIRGELRRAHSRIVRALDGVLAALPDRYRVADGSVSLREGRYVIPVRREGKSEVGGIIHGESATGATLFMEPPAALHLMNELHEMQREEAREVLRILREFTRSFAPLHSEFTRSQEALVLFDTLLARGRVALEWGAAVPEILPPGAGTYRVVEGRHPLLLLRGEGRVVPFTLSLEAGERALVVSGPNTGGKSVFLKAVGLLPALAASGVVPPVAPGSALPLFRELFTDIGDGQSIAENLSTFSAHLARLREILEGAGAEDLVLIDEMGTGTDPQEGAALARAILEELVRRGGLTVATSHLGELKRLDAPGSGIVNASLQFDPDRIEPTYQLLKGRPGRSYGLAIASRLGLPGPVLDAAASFISPEELEMEELLEQLERREKEARALVESLESERSRAVRLREELERRDAALREEERTAGERARAEARRVLLEARGEVEEAIARVREAGTAELEERSREARRRVEEAARRQTAPLRTSRPGGAPPTLPSEGLSVGDRVRLRKGGSTGVVLELRDDRVVVEGSGLRLRLPVDAVVRVGREEEAATPGSDPRFRGGWSAPELNPSMEADLRGLRVDEVELELGRALDRAVLGDLPELRIVHGKGTGAVRARVQELLRGDPRVRDFRPGGQGEGGHGVTVARFT